MELIGQSGLKHLGHLGWPEFGTLPGLCIVPGAQDPEVSLEGQEHFRSQREMGSVSSLWSCLPSLSAFVLSFVSLLLFIYVSTCPMSPPQLSPWRVHSGLDFALSSLARPLAPQLCDSVPWAPGKRCVCGRRNSWLVQLCVCFLFSLPAGLLVPSLFSWSLPKWHLGH